MAKDFLTNVSHPCWFWMLVSLIQLMTDKQLPVFLLINLCVASTIPNPFSNTGNETCQFTNSLTSGVYIHPQLSSAD